ncbi:hypothetical protein B0H14DRAFT_2506506 [Mycena olivaceomarginata]|nr:hypothetical protein B0H14DRAFT_2506506 [Mycena olivaceomarginata]
MDSQAPRTRRLPDVKFRVLVAGRANAGKTTILQRVCETTESPEVYRVTIDAHGTEIRELERSRGEHDVSDELVFSNHPGYIFHDSRGLESGGTDELGGVQNFIRDRSQRRKLKERLHVVWSVSFNQPNHTF